MKRGWRIAILALVVVAVSVIVTIKIVPPAKRLTAFDPGLPSLYDYGSSTCVPCQMMQPILSELQKEYRGRANVVVVDVYENPDEAQARGIKLIPTQIFVDAHGNELYRHEGFIAKDEIIAKLSELGMIGK